MLIAHQTCYTIWLYEIKLAQSELDSADWQRETERERQREVGTEREGGRERTRERGTERQRERHTQRERERESKTSTASHADRQLGIFSSWSEACVCGSSL